MKAMRLKPIRPTSFPLVEGTLVTKDANWRVLAVNQIRSVFVFSWLI
jgi:hypothetical protein